MPTLPPKPSYDPASLGVRLVRPVTQPEVRVAKRNGTMKAITALVTAAFGTGGGGYLAHKAGDKEASERGIKVEQKLEDHIAISNERHLEVKGALKVIEDEQRADRERRARETEAMFDALRVPKEKRGR